MVAPKESVIAQALELSVADRQELIDRLFKSLPAPGDDDGQSDGVFADPEVAAEWDRELDRRLADIESGRATMVPWEDVRARLLRRLIGPTA